MTSLVCVDANVIIRALIPGSLTPQALTLLSTVEESGAEIIGPALLAFEVTSGIRRLVYLRGISAAAGEASFARFLEMNVRLVGGARILSRAWALAKEFNMTRAYDSSYLAVAESYQCDLWTADERLYNVVSRKLTWVKRLGNVRA